MCKSLKLHIQYARKITGVNMGPKTILSLALSFVSLSAFADQTPEEWTQEHFGVNILLPFKNPNTGGWLFPSYAVQPWDETDTGVTASTAYTYANSGSTSDVYGSAMFTDSYWLTNRLPEGTWIRTPAYTWEMAPDPTGAIANQDVTYLVAVLKNNLLGYPARTDPKLGLNVLWNLTPAVFPGNSNWNTLDNQPTLRDPWRPVSATYSALSTGIENFINYANGYLGAFGGWQSQTTYNWLPRQAFQLGNEPAVGHPGGADTGPVGSWTGLGPLMQGTMLSHTWGANFNSGAWGTNVRVLPAFSMQLDFNQFSAGGANGGVGRYNTVDSGSPGVNELFSYYDEMFGPSGSPYTWANQCTRRAIHFASPTIQKVTNDARGNKSYLNDQLNYPYETASQYAERWVQALRRAVIATSRLSMPGSMPAIVDITECYITSESVGLEQLAEGQSLGGSTWTFSGKSLADVRYQARYMVRNGTTQVPPSRNDILAAIRTELMNNPIPNLGRIYWWGAYDADPRFQTGLLPSQEKMMPDGQKITSAVTNYEPAIDYRLTRTELRTLFPNMAP